MAKLTEHFAREEFEKDGPMPESCVASYTALCQNLLESVRAHFNEPIEVTSGYRSPEANAAANGVPNSEHMATADWCAADWYLPSMRNDMRPAFDWIRQSDLPFHQVVLKHGDGGDVIHISWNLTAHARQALEGATYN
jgi:hypothetical protein